MFHKNLSETFFLPCKKKCISSLTFYYWPPKPIRSPTHHIHLHNKSSGNSFPYRFWDVILLEKKFSGIYRIIVPTLYKVGERWRWVERRSGKRGILSGIVWFPFAFACRRFIILDPVPRFNKKSLILQLS